MNIKNLFRIRTVTGFLSLHPSDFPLSVDDIDSCGVGKKVSQTVSILRDVENELSKVEGYTVQTIRLATNPFGEWLIDDSESSSDSVVEHRLRILDCLLEKYDITFCSLGPAQQIAETNAFCSKIIQFSPRFSCSSLIPSGDVQRARAAAQCIIRISQLGNDIDKEQSDLYEHVVDGLGNFRFCAAASCKPFIPFFPVAKSKSNNDNGDDGKVKFALGLENGALACQLLDSCKSIANIKTEFKQDMSKALAPVQDISKRVAARNDCEYLGIDSSLNPSLDVGGSVAEAVEKLAEIHGGFGSAGTLGAAAAITEALQSLSDIQLTGYCGLMLPVCEDRRLTELANAKAFGISDLLSISSVCGVGVDTVPIPGDCNEDELTSFLLDVAGIAGRWNKSLSCRVFPVPGKSKGDFTTFDFPHLINCQILGL